MSVFCNTRHGTLRRLPNPAGRVRLASRYLLERVDGIYELTEAMLEEVSIAGETIFLEKAVVTAGGWRTT